MDTNVSGGAVSRPRIDLPKLEAAIRCVLEAVGEEPSREGLRNTPARVARMYAEMLAGLSSDPAEHLAVTFAADHSEMVILRDIRLASVCEHHLLPFTGVVHIGYIPKGRVVGLSKLAPVVDVFARRPQMQERLTSQIADTIMEHLQPDGVAVVVEASHACLTVRGVQKPGAAMISSAVRGGFFSRPETRAEFFALIGYPGRVGNGSSHL